MTKIPRHEYTVVQEVVTQDLVRSVEHLMSKGWTPCGGVAVVIDGSRIIKMQAMSRTTMIEVKDEECHD